MTPADMAELRRLCDRVMANESRRLSQCAGKQRFDNRVDANRSIRPKAKGVVEVYRCGLCASYHVGGQTEERKVMKARKQIIRRKRCELL